MDPYPIRPDMMGHDPSLSVQDAVWALVVTAAVTIWMFWVIYSGNKRGKT